MLKKKSLLRMAVCWGIGMLGGFVFQANGQANLETQYFKMRDLAQKGNYSQARAEGQKILADKPDYYDVSVLMGRIYIWEQKYDSANVVINQVLTEKPNYSDAVDAQYDLAFFSGNMKQVVAMGDTLIAKNPSRVDMMEKYALAQLALGDRPKAVEMAKQILAIDPENKVALDILNNKSARETPINVVRTEIYGGYSFDTFDVPYSRWWDMYTLGITKPTSWGSIGGRVNAGYLNGDYTESNVQVEAESYIHLNSQMYMMALYGFSGSQYFPSHKAALEFWHNLPAEMAASLGASYYRWDDDIFVGTASLEKYLGKYWLCLRAYAHFKPVGVSGSYYFTARRYFNDIEFVQATIGTGTAPDEPFDIVTVDQRLNAYSIRLAGLKRLSDRFKLRGGVGYSYEEHQPGDYRNRYEGYITLIYGIGK